MSRKKGGYAWSTAYFVFGLLLTLVSLFDVMGIYSAYAAELHARRLASYPSEIQLSIYTRDRMVLEGLGRLPGAFEEPVNILLEDLLIESSDSIYSWYVTVLFSEGSPLRVWMTDGQRLSFENCGNSRVIAAGRNRTAFARMENGTLTLHLGNQEAFELAATIGMAGTDFQDGLLVMRYADLPEEWKDKLFEDGVLGIKIQSEAYLPDEAVNRVVSLLCTGIQVSGIDAQRVSDGAGGTVLLRRSGLETPILIYMFCGAVLLQVSSVWIRRREKEFMIRKAFGYSELRLAGKILAEVAGLMIVSVFLYTAGRAVITALPGGEGGHGRLNGLRAEALPVAAVYFLCTLIFSAVRPVLCICHMMPAERLKQRGD